MVNEWRMLLVGKTSEELYWSKKTVPPWYSTGLARAKSLEAYSLGLNESKIFVIGDL
jgi:hypothetical protein